MDDSSDGSELLIMDSDQEEKEPSQSELQFSKEANIYTLTHMSVPSQICSHINNTITNQQSSYDNSQSNISMQQKTVQTSKILENAINRFEGSGPTQLIFIVFESYKQNLKQMAQAYDCQFTFSLNKYQVIAKNGTQLSCLQQCFKNIQKFIQGIKYINMTKSTNDKQSIKYYYHIYSSKYYKQYAKSLDIEITKFNRNVYFHCKAEVENLQGKIKQITNHGNIFCLSYFHSRSNFQDRNINRVINNYFRKIIDNNQKKFEEINVKKVELNQQKGKILVIAELKKSCLLGKNIVKNALEAYFCVVFNRLQLSKQQYKTIIKYCEKLSKYPIHFENISEQNYALISKDSIISQVLLKQNMREILHLEQDIDIGVHLLSRLKNVMAKIQLVKQFSKDKNFNIFKVNQQRYLRPFIITEKKKPQKEKNQDILNFLSDMANKFAEKKEKWDTKPRKIYYEPEKQDKQRYIIKDGPKRDPEFSKQIKRDVLISTVLMKKKFMVQYNLSEQNQITDLLWQVNQSNIPRIITKSEIKKGQYFMGTRKGQLYKIEKMLTVI